MSKFIESMLSADSLTDNGAVTNSTSSNFCLDLFFLAGACRNVEKDDLFNAISKAYNENRIKALKVIFWAGDIRQGAGERRFFKTALEWLKQNHPDDLATYVSYIPEYSRWDVLFDLVDNEAVFNYLIQEFKAGQNGLLFKWLPRKNYATDKKVSKTESKKNLKDKFGNKVGYTKSSSSSEFRVKRSLFNGLAHKIQKACNISAKEYRKYVVDHSSVVENQMCAKEWDKITYSAVPSVALHKYNKAWYRNDGKRFEKYIEDVKSGKTKINASAIFPHDIIKNVISFNHVNNKLTQAEITQWNNLPNYLEGRENSIIPICDTSGSMTWENNALAMKISLAMGLYISERNQGPFKDAFITFSNQPTFQYLKGDINSRLQQLIRQNMGYNTDIERVFDLILDKAIENNLSQDDMPKTILIISDMEFDSGTTGGTVTTHKAIQKKYQKAGYECPRIVYWNVNGRPGNVPVKRNDFGAALISGASPSILRAIFNDELDPITIMNKVIESDRYSFIHE